MAVKFFPGESPAPAEKDGFFWASNRLLLVFQLSLHDDLRETFVTGGCRKRERTGLRFIPQDNAQRNLAEGAH